MPPIQLIKAGTPTVVLSVEPDIGARGPNRPRQSLSRSEAGLYKVVVKSVPDREFSLVFSEMPGVDHDALVVFFESSVVNFSERPFTYVDLSGVSWQVRYLDGHFPAPRVTVDVYRVAFVLGTDRGPLD